jgi:hypothetical protein
VAPTTIQSLASCTSKQPAFGILPLKAGGVGQIFDPGGKPFTPRGIGVMEYGMPAASELRTGRRLLAEQRKGRTLRTR